MTPVLDEVDQFDGPDRGVGVTGPGHVDAGDGQRRDHPRDAADRRPWAAAQRDGDGGGQREGERASEERGEARSECRLEAAARDAGRRGGADDEHGERDGEREAPGRGRRR